MRVLITVNRGLPQRYLVSLFTRSLIEEIRSLINDRKHYEAMATAFRKGKFERQVFGDDFHEITADLILSEDNASWDHM